VEVVVWRGISRRRDGVRGAFLEGGEQREELGEDLPLVGEAGGGGGGDWGVVGGGDLGEPTTEFDELACAGGEVAGAWVERGLCLGEAEGGAGCLAEAEERAGESQVRRVCLKDRGELGNGGGELAEREIECIEGRPAGEMRRHRRLEEG
jgi:hypothetical protein